MKAVFRYALAPADLALIQERVPALEIIQCPNDEGLMAALADAEILVGGWSLSSEMVKAAPKLRWAQSVFNGVDTFLPPELAERGIVLTNFRGASAPNMAEQLMALMLGFARGLPVLAERQARSEWKPQMQPPKLFELTGQRLGLIGFGEIGRELARRARAFDMEVWAVRRSGAGSDPLLDRLLGSDALPELLASSDHVVLAAPSTPETRGLMNAERLGLMKPSAYLYNVGRGDLVDQAALAAAVEGGKIAGAGLDVTSPEPLPVDSPLWKLPNVVITGHTSGISPLRAARGLEIILDNLARYTAGEELRNRVDLTAGY